MTNTYSAKEVLTDTSLLTEFQNRQADCFAKVAEALCGVRSHEINRDQYLKAKEYVRFHARRLRLNDLVRQR